MNPFKKNIYRTSVEDEIVPPSSFSYDIPRGQLLGKLKGRSINDTNLIIV